MLFLLQNFDFVCKVFVTKATLTKYCMLLQDPIALVCHYIIPNISCIISVSYIFRPVELSLVQSNSPQFYGWCYGMSQGQIVKVLITPCWQPNTKIFSTC